MSFVAVAWLAIELAPQATAGLWVGARDGGDPVVRGETGDQTDQKSRSADPRAATSMIVMDISIHASFVPHNDEDSRESI